MELIQGIKSHNILVICTKPYIYCKVFEDNSGALELAKLPKLCPCTKHINVCYTTIFASMSERDLLKSSPLEPPTKLLMY
jgi:hypothetical protein